MNDYYSEIVSHCKNSKEEICGFLLNNGEGGLSPYVTKNVSTEDRTKTFEISAEDQQLFYNTGRVEAFFHSHVTGDESFSKDDIRSSENSGLPLFVYSLESKRFNLHIPKTLRENFYDRSFIAGLRDCYQLISDYFGTKFSLKFPYFPRTSTQLNFGIPNWINQAERVGLKRVDPLSAFDKDDILFMSILDGGNLNHLAIYQGDNLMLHQLIGRTSGLTTLGNSWRRSIKAVFRQP